MRVLRNPWVWTATPILVIVASYATFTHHVDVRWQATVALADRWQREIEALPRIRPVLWGEARDGEAFAAYERAMAGVAGAQTHDRWLEYRKALRVDPQHAVQLRTDLTRDHAPVLDDLRDGAHRRAGPRPIDWHADYRASSLFHTRTVVNLAVAEAHRLADTGEDLEAARVLLDALQLGRDVATTPILIDEMIGAALIAIASKEALLDASLVERLSEPALRALDEGLRRVDEGIRSERWSYRGDLVLFVHGVASTTGTRVGEFGSASWRHGFSFRLACAEYLQTAARFFAEIPGQRAPWPEVRAYFDAAASLRDSSDPMVQGLANYAGAESTRRSGLAALRLARASVAYRLTGDAPRLDDPFGDTLGAEPAGDGALRIWSVGADDRQREGLTFTVRR